MVEQVEKDTNKAPSGGNLGTFVGVFTPSILTILGIILFLRMGFVVGSAGLLKTFVILGIATAITVLTSLSLSAIATNMRVKGGGDYFLISRTLGVSFGGAIGIVLFLAQSVSIAFYAIGFGEAMTSIFNLGGSYWTQVIAGVATVAIFGMAWLGSDWASRFQFVVMGFLVAALLSFFIGAIAMFDGGTLAKNMTSPAKSLPFWAIFAIFFPAVTGFTQGVSMSGDLEDPSKSLPKGTFAAVGVSTVVYIFVAILFAAALPAQVMITDTNAMSKVAWLGWVIGFGVVAATLSSAMASFMGAPRILQALAADKIFGFLNPFAKGEGESNNPRRGVLLSGGIALITILLGNLDVIAPVVSMFFLISYGLLNYATYYEADAASPSFRPRFKWFDKRLSLLGAVACVLVMLAISPTAGGIALVVLFALYQYLERSNTTVRWADSQHAHHYKRARSHLWSIANEIGHPRDWRPQTLVFAEDAPRRETLLRFASWMEGGSGLTMAVSILEGSGAAMRKLRAEVTNELKKEIATQGVVAYPLVVLAPEKRAATELIMQTAGVGPLQANTSLFSWLDDPSDALVGETAPNVPQDAAPGDAAAVNAEDERMIRFGKMLQNQVRYGANVVLLEADEVHWKKLLATAPEFRRIDVWWWDTPSSRLMLLIAYLFTRTDAWLGATLRVLAPVKEGQDAKEALAELHRVLDDARIEAEAVVLEKVDPAILVARSGDASVVLLPLHLRKNLPCCPVDLRLDELLKQLPVTGLVLAAGEVMLDADPDSGPLGKLNTARDAADEANARAIKAEKAAEEAKDKAEKLAKKQAEDAEKLARKQAEEAEKLAKKQAEEAEKLAKKQAKEEAKEEAKAAKGTKAAETKATSDVETQTEAAPVGAKTTDEPKAEATETTENAENVEATEATEAAEAGRVEEALSPEAQAKLEAAKAAQELAKAAADEALAQAKEDAEDAFKRAAKARTKAAHLREEADALESSISPAASAKAEAEKAAEEAKVEAKAAEEAARAARITPPPVVDVVAQVIGVALAPSVDDLAAVESAEAPEAEAPKGLAKVEKAAEEATGDGSAEAKASKVEEVKEKAGSAEEKASEGKEAGEGDAASGTSNTKEEPKK